MDIISFFLGVLFMTITPGPNNILLFTMSSNYGYKKCFRYILGAFLMGILISVSVEIGLNKLFELFPFINEIIAWMGFVFMLYLSYKVITTKKNEIDTEKSKPFGFLHGLLFQFINPKTWIATISFINLYMSLVDFKGIHFVIIPLALNVLGTIGNITWVFLGSILSQFIQHKLYGKIFNYIMGGILIYLGITFISPYL